MSSYMAPLLSRNTMSEALHQVLEMWRNKTWLWLSGAHGWVRKPGQAEQWVVPRSPKAGLGWAHTAQVGQEGCLEAGAWAACWAMSQRLGAGRSHRSLTVEWARALITGWVRDASGGGARGTAGEAGSRKVERGLVSSWGTGILFWKQLARGLQVGGQLKDFDPEKRHQQISVLELLLWPQCSREDMR